MVTQGMLPCEAITRVQERLAHAGCPDAAYDARELYILAIGRKPEGYFTSLTQAQATALEEYTVRREQREPLQYICGQWDFLRFTLKVGAGVLCPRADTEIVAQCAAACIQQCALERAPQVLELCAGTGCIGLGVKMFLPNAQVTMLEKSKEALVYLRENVMHALDTLGMAEPAPYGTVVEGDLFSYHETLTDAQFDLLVSNPPYLTDAEMTCLQPEVSQEPAMALVAGEDGLVFYRAIAERYARVIKPGGYIVLEIGCTQAQAVMEILKREGFTQRICYKDYGGKDRCIVGKKV